MKKILTVCANGDSKTNLDHTKEVVGKLLEMRIIGDELYEHHSANPIAPKEDSLVYSKHLVEKFGEKKVNEKYSVIIFQYCNCLRNPVPQFILDNWEKKTLGKPFNVLYNQSPFYYENIVDVLADSLENGGLFVNLERCYYSGTYIIPVDNREKLYTKFLHLNTFTMLKMNSKYLMDTLDIWKKKI